MKKDAPRKAAFNLPNSLTLFRLACIPAVLICLYFPGKLGSFLAALFFGTAFVTDLLDGFFARRRGDVTKLGKFLDPMADKILVSVTMIMLIPLGRIPAWIVMLIVAREMAVTGLRGIAVMEGTVMQASSLGKYKTFFQSLATAFLCLHYKYIGLNFHKVGMVLLWAALIFTLWSAWAYFKEFYRVLLPRNPS
ncbi:MAG: CDP-diacylglycerol--glycerol-3-phosphate 3-phosphatidyltransferase [Deltaproteobacteria bacterium]|nr:CDP-diacylglycerol--glycerol-3-phosphate 3-phosphatidyltransferase [Deltaproteobacteria bacterium]MBW1921197.1 CDP-diacylglycerol--glycerol-3-phosphate 3-phosphatidyltransferase [Deltaproteobacteria bacterium]MBW1933479.1 CDP-diacylglycerol--glycerol-3-phosphate 3-phosphatidyltransferase [Deltaproteobacteria bacterium]MBW1977555.1 CDP-diacylglycerol--glycerol-3-phosphate 3-phosphatidyltransferase [Deltaproteobacteria bacterium]MBW2044962.1 CDP-diacylglycerol--glycerol-3-phosphate 3-phosphati